MPPLSPKVQSILKELRRQLEALYGDRLVKVILFGSQARGDVRSDSDIDIAILLQGKVDPNVEIDHVVPITAQLSLENDVLISCVYVSADRYNSGQTPLLVNLRAEGSPSDREAAGIRRQGEGQPGRCGCADADQVVRLGPSRAYYAMFYLAQAFRLEKQLEFSSHAGVISAFGREFGKTGRIPRNTIDSSLTARIAASWPTTRLASRSRKRRQRKCSPLPGNSSTSRTRCSAQHQAPPSDSIIIDNTSAAAILSQRF